MNTIRQMFIDSIGDPYSQIAISVHPANTSFGRMPTSFTIRTREQKHTHAYLSLDKPITDVTRCARVYAGSYFIRGATIRLSPSVSTIFIKLDATWSGCSYDIIWRVED